MTDKELRKLSRAELLEMLIAQVKENEALQARLDEAAAQLEDRRIAVEESGSLAEAALRLNQVFADADAAAAQYISNLKQRSEQCERMEADTRKKCEEMLAKTESRCRAAEEKALAWCRARITAAARGEGGNEVQAQIQSQRDPGIIPAGDGAEPGEV